MADVRQIADPITPASLTPDKATDLSLKFLERSDGHWSKFALYLATGAALKIWGFSFGGPVAVTPDQKAVLAGLFGCVAAFHGLWASVIGYQGLSLGHDSHTAFRDKVWALSIDRVFGEWCGIGQLIVAFIAFAILYVLLGQEMCAALRSVFG